jgi:hypothetical protein
MIIGQQKVNKNTINVVKTKKSNLSIFKVKKRTYNNFCQFKKTQGFFRSMDTRLLIKIKLMSGGAGLQIYRIFSRVKQIKKRLNKKFKICLSVKIVLRACV